MKLSLDCLYPPWLKVKRLAISKSMLKTCDSLILFGRRRYRLLASPCDSSKRYNVKAGRNQSTRSTFGGRAPATAADSVLRSEHPRIPFGNWRLRDLPRT